MKYKVLPSTKEDVNEGWIWVNDPKLWKVAEKARNPVYRPDPQDHKPYTMDPQSSGERGKRAIVRIRSAAQVALVLLSPLPG